MSDAWPVPIGGDGGLKWRERGRLKVERAGRAVREPSCPLSLGLCPPHETLPVGFSHYQKV